MYNQTRKWRIVNRSQRNKKSRCTILSYNKLILILIFEHHSESQSTASHSMQENVPPLVTANPVSSSYHPYLTHAHHVPVLHASHSPGTAPSSSHYTVYAPPYYYSHPPPVYYHPYYPAPPAAHGNPAAQHVPPRSLEATRASSLSPAKRKANYAGLAQVHALVSPPK